jgi:hypothetical protein
MKSKIIAAVVASSLAACAPMGAEVLKASRPVYNMAVQQTNDQDLLLNIVRLQYRDTLYFTTVERIVASQEVNASIGASGSISQTRNSPAISPPGNTVLSSIVTQTLGLGPATVAINEKPTVFYAPLEGEKFVRQMMTPMNPDLLMLLVKSGWSLDRVFAVSVQQMNGLQNAPTASGPRPSREPEFRAFREAIKLLRQLQRENKIELAHADAKGALELLITGEAVSDPRALRFKELMKLAPNGDRFRIEVGSHNKQDDHTIVLATRALIAAMSYLSQGVEAPERDVKAGKVRLTETADGQPFNWQDMLGEVFKVSSSADRPDDASVAIHYRDAWFYIDDRDLDSKSTFVLLTQLIALHSAPAPAGPAMSFAF